jgi:hypothetical protein
MQTTESSFSRVEWKAEESTGNRVVPERDFGGLASLGPPHVLLPDSVIRVSFSGTLNECLRHDGREDQQIAAEIHISAGYFSKLLRGVWEAQIKRLVRFMRNTRCIAPLQWIAHQVGCDVVVRAPIETELERLRRENAELKAFQRRRVPA